jgi:hypothetical protein
MAVAAAVLALDYLIGPGRRLFDAWHTWEIAGAVERVTGPFQDTVVCETSRGLRISGSSLSDRGQDVRIVAFSRPGTLLGASSAAELAKLIGDLCCRKYPNSGGKLFNSESGTFHFVIRVAGRSTPLPRFLQSTIRTPLRSRGRLAGAPGALVRWGISAGWWRSFALALLCSGRGRRRQG